MLSLLLSVKLQTWDREISKMKKITIYNENIKEKRLKK